MANQSYVELSIPKLDAKVLDIPMDKKYLRMLLFPSQTSKHTPLTFGGYSGIILIHLGIYGRTWLISSQAVRVPCRTGLVSAVLCRTRQPPPGPDVAERSQGSAARGVTFP